MQSKRLTDNRTEFIRLLAIQFVALLLLSFVMGLRGKFYNQTDLQIYYESSLRLMQGQMPYRDFMLEYPPLSLLVIVLPRLVTLGQPLSFPSYVSLFMIENVMLSILVALTLVQVVSHLQPWCRSVWVLRVYVLLTIISSPLLLKRYDLFPTLLTLQALLSVLVGRPTLAGIWLGFGISAKLYPVVLLPIFSVYYLASRKYGALLRLLLGSVGAICLTLLPFALTAGGKLLSFLRYHQLRGLQLESLPAGAISLAHVLGLTEVKIVFNYGSYNLVSPLVESILKWLPFVFILAFVGVIASCLGRFLRERATKGAITAESLVTYITAALLTFMATCKVFSPQYIIWVLPFAPLLRPQQVVIMTAIFAMTTTLFSVAYIHLLSLQTIPVLLLNLRNILVVVLLLWLLLERLPASVQVAFVQQRRTVLRWFTR